MATSRPLLQESWNAYLGWTFHSFVAEEQARATLRVIAERPPFRLVVYRNGDSFGYAVYDKFGKSLLKLNGNVSGTSAGSEIARQSVPQALLQEVLFEIALLTNEIADWQCTGYTETDTGTTFRVRAPWASEADVTLTRSGACATVTLRTNRQAVYRPAKVTQLTQRHKYYSEWIRDHEAPIIGRRVTPGGTIYTGE